MLTQLKIRSLKEISEVLEKDRKEGFRIIQCHGVFDLLHPGHIRHFQEAKKQGDKLVVTVTPDRYVNKGPGRPVFNEKLRLEALSALDCIDYVVLNDSPDAVSCIDVIKPNVYVKGQEYKDHGKDVTNKISKEAEAVVKNRGSIHYTNDIVFSSSSLLNRFFDPLPIGLQKVLKNIKDSYGSEDIIEKVESLKGVKVLVIGDAIIDEYQYVEPLGQSGKGTHMAACNKEKEVFLGGSLIIANHLAEFSDNVALLTALGKDCSYTSFVKNTLNPKVQCHFIESTQKDTLIKKRYVMKDGNSLSKLFETYSSNGHILDEAKTKEVIERIQTIAKGFDLVLVSDFGNGFINFPLIEAISKLPNFLAVNTQCNSGNRGFNVITHYKRANYISLNEPEARLAVHDRRRPIEVIAKSLLEKMNCETLSLTRGVEGVFCYNEKVGICKIPALNTNTIDRVGAGDSYFALSSLCAVKNYPLSITALVGSIAAALDVQIVGNKEPVKKASLMKFLIRLLK
ncbi:MAG: PfkB family carbohydrate kinase [Chlamydiota bacterium]|jgi:rfaE bifunctional protein nucleotidyltransferase chain/domain